MKFLILYQNHEKCYQFADFWQFEYNKKKKWHFEEKEVKVC